MKCAVFQSPGRQPFVIDIFLMLAIGLHTKSTNSFSNLGWFSSGPSNLFLSIFFIYISFSYCDLINNFVASWLKVWEVSFQFVGEYTAELMLDELFSSSSVFKVWVSGWSNVGMLLTVDSLLQTCDQKTFGLSFDRSHIAFSYSLLACVTDRFTLLRGLTYWFRWYYFISPVDRFQLLCCFFLFLISAHSFSISGMLSLSFQSYFNSLRGTYLSLRYRMVCLNFS